MEFSLKSRYECVCILALTVHCAVQCVHLYFCSYQGELNRRRGRQGFPTLCCDVFVLLKNQFLRNNKNKGSRSNVNKHELVYCESSSNAPEMPDACLSIVLLFTIFIFVVTQKLVLQQSKTVTAKCTETPPSIQYLLDKLIFILLIKLFAL